jgi:hypothetical protein
MTTLLTDEQIFALAKLHYGGSKGHDLIWEDDPKYAAACDMPKDARWATGSVRAEQTLAFARALLAHADGVAVTSPTTSQVSNNTVGNDRAKP